MQPTVFVHSFASFLPPRAVGNDELSQLMDTSDAWITQRTGIRTRFWAEAPTTTSDLALHACRTTLDLAPGVTPDAIVAATLSPDYCFPGIGVLLQHKLGLAHIPAYDVRNQCSGFLYGLEMAAALVRAQNYRHILLVGAEVHSTGLDISTRGRDMAVLFGDGAGSCLVSAESARLPNVSFEFVGSELHSDGSHAGELWCEHPGSALFPTRLTEDLVRDRRIFPSMNGRKVFEHAVRRMVEVSRALLSRHAVSIEGVKLFVPHQANIRINQMVASELGLSENQTFNTIAWTGNTTAASIPICMSEALKSVQLRSGDYVLSAAFGSGFTWGAALLRVS